MKNFYKLWYRLDQLDAYLIWYSADEDGVLINKDGKIPVFRDATSLITYAEKLGLKVEIDNKPTLYNLDLIQKWLHKPRKETIDCAEFLNAWNLFDDIAATTDKLKAEVKIQAGKIYDKLFWGNNLPAMTPPGKHYAPIWSSREVEKIAKVLSYGLTMFRGQVVQV